ADSQPSYRKPKLKQTFNVYHEKETWIVYIVNELKSRINDIDDHMEFHSELQSEKAIARIILNGETIYSLNIYKNSIGTENGLSFYGVTGEINPGSSNSTNAWGVFAWSKSND